MYRRSTAFSRQYETDEDYLEDLGEEDHELYGYNLPPKYDGSRFSSNIRRQSHREEPALPKSTEGSDNVTVEHGEEVHCSDTYIKEECKTDPGLQSQSDTCAFCDEEKQNGFFDFGSEELLIITLILILSGSNDKDVLLLLGLLLALR